MNFENKLKQKIKELPELSHKEDLWDGIASRLDFEKVLSGKINELPECDCKENLWKQIENKLELSVVPTRRYNIRKIAFYGGIAATVVFLIGIVFFRNNENIKIESHEEYSYTETTAPATRPVSSDETLKYIEKWCLQPNDLCNTPEFVEEKNQLINIETGIKNINREIEKVGESPALIKSLIKMENQKADLIKGLIKKMNS